MKLSVFPSNHRGGSFHMCEEGVGAGYVFSVKKFVSELKGKKLSKLILKINFCYL